MDLRELKFGIEVETVGRTRQTVAEAIRTVVGGTVRHVGYPSSYDPWEVADPREGASGRSSPTPRSPRCRATCAPRS